MARLLALEWDAREARVAVGRTRGRDITIEQAFAVDLGPSDSGETFAVPNGGERIAAAMEARGVSAGDVLVAVGRTSIELRLLQLPQVPAEELPDLVRFQALRQFSAISDDWPVDYYRISSDEENVNVLAAAISPELVGQIGATCAAGQMTPTRLVLRPFTSASLLRRWNSPTREKRCLVVDLSTDEADLTVLDHGGVVFMRTVRLTGQSGSEAQLRALLGEIRRTSVAAQNQLGGSRVEQVVLCGAEEENAALKAAIESQLSVGVEALNPAAVLTFSRQLQRDPPANIGRYASLFGMLADEAETTPHAIDFLHPRQRPKPPNTRLRNGLVAALTACLVISIIGYGFLKLRERDQRIADLEKESAGLDERVKEAQQQVHDLNEVKKFAESDVTWLDEVLELANDLPSAEDALLTQVTLAERSPSGGKIILEGYVRDFPSIHDMERKLTDERHRVIGDRGTLDTRRETYKWQFRETIEVKPSPRHPAQDQPASPDVGAEVESDDASSSEEEAPAEPDPQDAQDASPEESPPAEEPNSETAPAEEAVE